MNPLSNARPSSRSLSRRALFHGLVGAGVGSAVPVVDPVLAAIDTHAKAYAEFDQALGIQEGLEKLLLNRQLPYDEATLLADPRWTVLQSKLDQLDEAEARAAAFLMKIQPITEGGIVALQQYIRVMTSRGYQWSPVLRDHFQL